MGRGVSVPNQEVVTLPKKGKIADSFKKNGNKSEVKNWEQASKLTCKLFKTNCTFLARLGARMNKRLCTCAELHHPMPANQGACLYRLWSTAKNGSPSRITSLYVNIHRYGNNPGG